MRIFYNNNLKRLIILEQMRLALFVDNGESNKESNIVHIHLIHIDNVVQLNNKCMLSHVQDKREH